MPCNSINAITRAWQYAYGNNHCGGIISHLVQTDANKKGSTTPFIDNLEIIEIFKDEGKEEEVSVMDLIK